MKYNDAELESLCCDFERLFVPIISDILDEMGFRNQCMDYGFRPIDPGITVAGRAFTLELGLDTEIYGKDKTEASLEEISERIERTFGLIPKHSVIVVSCNHHYEAGVWGELMSTVAKCLKGARGAVIDGAIRDVSRIRKVDFPVWYKTTSPQEAFGRMALRKTNERIWCGGRMVSPEDFIVADEDGIIVVPTDKVNLRKVLEKAKRTSEFENKARAEIRKGHSLQDVFRKYSVL